MFVVYLLYTNRGEYFNFAIDFSRSIELGLLVVKLLLIVAVLVVDLKTFKTINKEWRKETFVQKEEKREGEIEYKRMGKIRKWIFYWRLMGAKKYMEKYHDRFTQLQKMIGKIKGDETKELMKTKEESIKGVLIWTDDFQITKALKNKNGEIIKTDIPVTEEYLKSLSLQEIYDDYLVDCIEIAGNFINGKSDVEKEELI